MKVILPYLIVLLVRGEGSKTPLTVLPHEVDILRVMHGDENVVETDIVPPVKEAEFDTADEYARLEENYRGGNEMPNPTRLVFRNLDDFEDSFAGSQKAPKAPKETKPAGTGDGDPVRDALVAEAKALKIKNAHLLGIPKLEAAIADAKSKLENQE